MRIPAGITVTAIAAALILAGVYRVASDRAWADANERIRTVELEKQNAIARGDTTRTILLDSIRVIARLAQQLEQERDRIDEQLQTERRFTAELLLAVRELRDSVRAGVVVVDTAADIRRVEATIRQAPFTARVTALVPRPPDSASIDLRVVLDPFRVGVRLGCGDSVDGSLVRAATVAAELPPWADATVELAGADPTVCNPLPRRPALSDRIRTGAPWAAAGAGAVLLIRELVELLTR